MIFFFKSKTLIFPLNLFVLLVLTTLISCEGKYNPRHQSGLDVSPDSLSLKVKQDNLDIDPEPGSYTYIIRPEDMVVPVVKADSITSSKSELKETVQKMAPIQIVVQSSLTDIEKNRPPLFSEQCLTAEYPVKCSSNKIAHFIRENLKFPTDAVITGYDGVEMVSIQINKDGEVDNIEVQSNKNGCKDCQAAAYSVIAAMPDKWVPALENGNPVATEVTIPIEFTTLN
jgi:TonB family protein